MTYTEIIIAIPDTALGEILIAALSEQGFEGFEEEEDRLHAFIPEEAFQPSALEALLAPLQLDYTRTEIAERNWNEEWEKNFEPVTVDTFCAVRASFHPPLPGVEYDLVITPKMSFGTGHHATTWMMLAAMQKIDFMGRRVLDFGTGTGVLAILAEKRGAGDVLAIDYDPWSIENARENVGVNGCKAIRLEKLDEIPASGPFDVILANINRNIILRELARMEQQLRPGGVILLSGLLQDDFEEIEKQALQHRLPISQKMTKDNWICLKLDKSANISAADWIN